MGNGIWKQKARDSIEEPSQSNEKLRAYRILPSAPPQKHMYSDNNYNPRAPDHWGLDSNYNNKEWAGFVTYQGACPEIDFFGKIGLHYYNQQKMDNLYSYPFNNSGGKGSKSNFSCEFQAQVRHAVENIDCLSAITTRCRLKPKNPEEEDDYSEWNKNAVDAFFKGDMPDWLYEDALMVRDNQQHYEMKESEMEEENECLHLYAELALFSKWESNWDALESAKPFEMKKIVVRTKEDVESKKKVKAENAIFYISFKPRCGQDCNSIIRKTTDRRPEHFSLEVKCLM